MSDEKLNVPLTTDEIEHVLNSGVITMEIRDALRAALAEHRESEWDRVLGLPWRVEQYHCPDPGRCDEAYVVLAAADVAVDGSNEIGLELPQAIADVIASAPRALRALAALLETTAQRACRESERVAQDEARAVLVDAGWPMKGEG